ncbi:F-box only protein 34 [Festucalex cinctus]
MLVKQQQRADVSGFCAPPRFAGVGRRPLSAIAANTPMTWAGPPPPPCCPTKDDPAVLLDVCAVIKPGHVREKIALFAPKAASHPGSHAPSARAGKVKSSRWGTGDAKRRRRSAGDKKPGNGLPTAAPAQIWAEGAEPKLSVGAMVAFLEERQRKVCHAMGRLPPVSEDPEGVRVSDAVAKLEGGGPARPRKWVGREVEPSPPPAQTPSDNSSSPPASDEFAAAPPTLAALPQDVLAVVFALLPTRSLAALKRTCRYFKALIEDYGVRPADSLWERDPRYRDDPCKRCKRRYGRGDASPCRWHHKPYCQALPGGPGFWMCCQRPRRDAPGCNVGLHDNRWVTAGRVHGRDMFVG